MSRAKPSVTASLSLLLVALAPQAQASVVATVELATDRDFRGITQTAQDPSLAVTVEYSGKGLDLGASAANAKLGREDPALAGRVMSDPSLEIDLMLGAHGAFSRHVRWQGGFIYHTFEIDSLRSYPEVYASVTWEWLTLRTTWTNEFNGVHEDANYNELVIDFPLGEGVTLGGHIGFSEGEYWNRRGDAYYDVGARVGYRAGAWQWYVNWVDGSDFTRQYRVSDGFRSSEGRVILSVSRRFDLSRESRPQP